MSDHPFSEPYRKEDASRAMIRAVNTVKSRRAAGQYLPYVLLQRLFKSLGSKEQEQLVDIIITTYSVIDHEEAIRYFGSYEKMLEADHSTTGSEYDMKETFLGKNDRCYARMADLVMQRYRLTDIHDMLAFSPERKWELFQWLRQETMATAEQIAAFLRIPLLREGQNHFTSEHSSD